MQVKEVGLICFRKAVVTKQNKKQCNVNFRCIQS